MPESAPHPAQRAQVELPPLTPRDADDLTPGAVLQACWVSAVRQPQIALPDASVDACHLDDVHADLFNLGGARWCEVQADRWEVAHLNAQRGHWCEVVVNDSRLGVVEAFDSD